MSTQINFINTSSFTIEVFWIDFENKEQKYAELMPGHSYIQQTYEGHNWILRDKVSGVALGTTSGQAGPSVCEPGTDFVSQNADDAVSVTFRNTTALAVNICWVDYSGKLVSYAKLRPGESYQQGTYAGHPWAFVSQHCGTVFGHYIPSKDQSQSHDIALRSLTSEAEVEIGFENATSMALTLEWVDFESKPVAYQSIAPGQTVRQSTYRSHPWLVRDRHSGVVVKVFGGFAEDADMRIDGAGLRALAGLDPVHVYFRNQLPVAVHADWLDFDGAPQRYDTLEPGEALSVDTFNGHPWRFTGVQSGEVVDLHIPGPTKSETKNISASLLNTAELSGLKVENTLLLDVDVMGVSEAGTPYPLTRLGHGASAHLSVKTGTELAMQDAASGHLIRRIAVQPGASEVELTPANMKSAGSSKACKVRFTNDTPFTIDVVWVDFQGKENAYATLKPGKAYTQSTYTHHVWRARERRTRKLVGLYVATDQASQQTSFRMASKTSAKPTGIMFKNDTMLALDVYWMDFKGKPVHYHTLNAHGSVGFQTYETHPWIVKDRQSGRVLDWAWGGEQDATVRINDRDIRPHESKKSVTVKFANRLPWPVDVSWIDFEGKEVPYASLEPGQSYDQQTFETHPWRIRQRHTGEVIAAYIARSRKTQRCDIRLRSEHSKVPTQIKFVNSSFLKVGVYWIDYSGREVQYATVEPRESYTQSTYMTHPWVIRDLASGEAVGFTVGARADQDFWITGRGVRSPKGSKSVNLTLRNTTGRRLDVNWIDFEGEEVDYGTLNPGQSLGLTTGSSHTWRFRDHDTGAEVDLYLATKRATQSYAITDKMVRQKERRNAELWPGEVALYEHENFGGRVWIVHQNLRDFTKVPGLNDQISSVRLGPDTAATFFQHIHFKGVNDVIYNNAAKLRGTDIGNDQLSSLQVIGTAPAMAQSIGATSRVTQDVDPSGRAVSYTPILRTVVSVPPMTGEVEIWATEQTDIRVGAKTHRIDPVKSARVKPNAAGKVILNIKPDELGVAALMLRTSGMAENERFFVFPDVDVHTKILALDKDTLWSNRRELGVDGSVSQHDVGQVEQALKALSSTVPAASRSLSHGRHRDRFVVTDRMPYASWGLNFGSTTVSPTGLESGSSAIAFAPLSAADADAFSAGATRLETRAAQWGFLEDVGDAFSDTGKGIGNFVVKTIPKTATTIAKETKDFVEDDVAGALSDAGDAVVNVVKPITKEIKNTANKIWVEGTGWVEEAATDVKKFAVDTTKEVVDGVSDIASDVKDTFEEIAEGAKEALSDAVETVIEIAVEVAGKVYTFVADTVEIVGKFMQKVIEKVGILWRKFVDFLSDLFQWDDILRTHDFVVGQIGAGFDAASGAVRELDEMAGEFFDYLKTEVATGLDSAIEKLGGGKVAAKDRDGGIDRSEISDKIDWFMSFIIGEPDEGPSDPAKPVENELRDRLKTLIPASVKTALNKLLTRFANELKSFVEDDMGVVVDAFFDSIALFQEAMNTPDKAFEMILSAILSMVKGIAITGLAALKAAVGIIFEIFALALELLKSAVMTDLDIPVISQLYKALTGRSLSAVSLMAMLVAIPATLIAKLAGGEPPFKAQTAIGQTLTEAERAEAVKKRDWAYVYGACHLIMNVVDVVADVQGAVTSQEASTSRQEVVTPGKTYRQPNGKKWKVPAETRTVTTPGKFKTDWDRLDGINPVSGFGKGLTVMKLIGFTGLVFAQISGNPTGHAGGLHPKKLRQSFIDAKSGGDRAERTAVMSRVVWGWQWLYVVLGGIDTLVNIDESFDAGGGISGKVMPISTSVLGGVHLVMMSVLVGFDIDEHNHLDEADQYDASVNNRRRYGWMTDTFPAVSKFCAMREINTGTYYIPLGIHTVLMVTIIGHLSEAIVYFVRASQEIGGDSFDL